MVLTPRCLGDVFLQQIELLYEEVNWYFGLTGINRIEIESNI
jgi:hypothetical protein